MTTARARREWARVLKTAGRGTPVIVTSHGQAVAAVVSIEQLRALERAAAPTFGEAIVRARNEIDSRDLRGPDPWAGVRDRSRGRRVDL